MQTYELALLLDLLKQPTAPFREQRVVDFVTGWLERQRLPFFLDPLGNIVVGCDSPASYRRLVAARTREPLRLFMAHLDHPGFHGERWLAADRLRVIWHGGAPVKHLAGAPIWIATPDGRMLEGRLHRARLLPGGRSIESAEVRVAGVGRSARPPATGLYGGFRFRAPVWRAGARLYAHAADDLVGVFAILATARRLRPARGAPFLGLLTRAEEVGFIGAIGHFELGWLLRARRPVVCVSLETSRTLPNALIGKGPVVRLGDRRTVFDPGALNVLTQVAVRTLPGRHQRRIMDGGTCEATAATVFGLRAIGISVPLGNYHNQGYEGGPDCRGPGGPAPEFVHLADVEGLIALCRGLLRPGLPWDEPWTHERRVYAKRRRSYRALLEGPAPRQGHTRKTRNSTASSLRN
ncbi:MAG TPA: hypothetical protein VF203_03985 [Burkholderiales bacterium]